MPLLPSKRMRYRVRKESDASSIKRCRLSKPLSRGGGSEQAEGQVNMMPPQVLPSDREARLIFTKLPSRVRRSLNDLAAASVCPTLEIVRRFHDGAGHPEFPDPPSTTPSRAQKTDTSRPSA